MLVLWGVGQGSGVIQGRKWGEWLRTGLSTTTGATCFWKICGGCWYESTIAVSRCTDVVGPVGGIKEGILPGVCIVANTGHALGQSFSILEK